MATFVCIQCKTLQYFHARRGFRLIEQQCKKCATVGKMKRAKWNNILYRYELPDGAVAFNSDGTEHTGIGNQIRQSIESGEKVTFIRQGVPGQGV